MKTYEQLLPKFSNEPELEYVDKFEYSNHSIYRGQMKKVDESMRAKMLSDTASNLSGKNGRTSNVSLKKENEMD